MISFILASFPLSGRFALTLLWNGLEPFCPVCSSCERILKVITPTVALGSQSWPYH